MSNPSIHLHKDIRPWGQRARTRHDELLTLCALMERRAGTPEATELANHARTYLQRADAAIDQKMFPWGHSGAAIDAAETSMNAAFCVVMRFMPPESIAGKLPDFVAIVREHLLESDPRRAFVEHLSARPTGQTITNEEREALVAAVRAALSEQEREYIRVRDFCMIVNVATAVLMALVVTFGFTMAKNEDLLPLCFNPNGNAVCPTQSLMCSNSGVAFSEASVEPGLEQASISAATCSSRDPDEIYASLTRPWDYPLIQSVGLLAAAIAATVTLRRMRGSAVPYSVPLALGLLKLPTGALTAVLGLLLMRGLFVPGLTALDSSAQIVAWGIVFGYGQQLFTGLVDDRGRALLSEVGGIEPEAERKKDRP